MSDELWNLAVAGESLETQRAAIDGALLAKGLTPSVVAVLRETSVPGALLRPQAGGASRAGGGSPPLVEPGWAWPESDYGRLAFLAEIRLDDLVGVAGLGLPRASGSLLFFHDETPGLDDLLLESSHVVYLPGDAETEVAAGVGESQTDVTWPLAGATVPLSGLNDEFLDGLDELQAGDAYTPINDVLNYQVQGWRFLGAADTDFPLASRIRWWFESPDSEADRHAFSEAERGGDGWRCLLQLRQLHDPASGQDMSWVAGASLTFCIPEADLAAWRFDRVISFIGSR